MRLIKCSLARITVGTKCAQVFDWSGLGAKWFMVLNGPRNRAGSLALLRLSLNVIGAEVESPVPLSTDPEES